MLRVPTAGGLICLLFCLWLPLAFADFLPSVVYRVDTRDPLDDWVFQRGFQPHGHNLDLVAHVTGASILDRSSGFVSTTDQRVAAERIALARLQQGNPMVWIYEIRATEQMFEVNASLRQAIRQLAARDGHGSQQMQNLESIEALYGLQYEWVSTRIESESIRTARAYQLAEASFQSDTQPRMVEVAHTELFNPNYRAMATTGSPQPWAILPEQTEVPREQMHSLERGVRAIGLGWCALALGSAARLPRGASQVLSYRVPVLDPDCVAPQTPAALALAKVWDSSLNALVYRPVPWQTEESEQDGRKLTRPRGCRIDAGTLNSAQLLVHCLEGQDYAHFVVVLKARGSVYQWVDTAFKGGRTGEDWFRDNSAIPVVRTRWMLTDYGYSIRQVFSPVDHDWSSQVLVAPYYPDLTYASRRRRAL